MTATGPSKKDFADLVNQMVGQNVVNDKMMDDILKNAKNSYNRNGLDGFFEYIRRLTGAPLSNQELKQLMDLVVGAGRTDKALSSLVNQNWLPREQAERIDRRLDRAMEQRKPSTRKKKS
ncbi:hypothetical protein C8P63_11725 [Melghirimyces profundicolus]|uniref:Uncharacterized protein n=1 Tax=Melghirimyces profundicolus TaxID=1242148 RepID=A0A2T6BQD5_9BACL|nr:hypothetical protein [Melghirimyces profundicolus]PTX58278.1 hypothetical protein C8P63_11725 [Melghirimyces profundicolus]